MQKIPVEEQFVLDDDTVTKASNEIQSPCIVYVLYIVPAKQMEW